MLFRHPRIHQYSNTILNMTEVQPESGASNKDVLWYIADVGPIPEPARDLLENYSGIHPDHLKDHVTEVVCLKSNRLMN